jgi:selenocysteine lyase/cysteine desulfurase
MNEAFRSVRAREFPGPQEGIFLNAASWGLIPRSAAGEAAGFTLRRNRAHGFDLAELGQIQRRAKSAIATLLNVEPREVTLAPNTSFGVNLAAALVGSGPPGSIVLSAGEFPANVFPWKLLEERGFDVVIVPADELGRPREEALISALHGSDVRALAVSAVQFASGYHCDLARLGEACRARGVLFCVDAIQALGAVPLDPRSCHVDVLASGAQKWLCSPYGSGFAWVRQELHDRLTPPMVSWLAMDGATRFEDMLHYELDWRSDGRKFELATLGLQDYLGMARSIEVMLELGVDNIRQHIHGLHDPIIDWVRSRSDAQAVTPLDADRRAGILSITHPRLEEAAVALAQEGVVISVREGALRFAPHYYNTAEEIAQVVRLLDEAAG